MIFWFCKHKKYLFFSSFIILIACQLQEPTKTHGIVFLENRASKLTIDKSNSNDAINILGHPHTKSISNDNMWLYFERTLSKGEFHKLGQNILKTNNVLILEFNKFGILKNKALIGKDSKNKIMFSKEETINNVSQKSFVEKFIQSLKTKMYKK